MSRRGSSACENCDIFIKRGESLIFSGMSSALWSVNVYNFDTVSWEDQRRTFIVVNSEKIQKNWRDSCFMETLLFWDSFYQEFNLQILTLSDWKYYVNFGLHSLLSR